MDMQVTTVHIITQIVAALRLRLAMHMLQLSTNLFVIYMEVIQLLYWSNLQPQRNISVLLSICFFGLICQ